MKAVISDVIARWSGLWTRYIDIIRTIRNEARASADRPGMTE